MAEEKAVPAVEVPGEELKLSLTPQQQAEDITRRMEEFNKELDPLCKKYHFVIAVVRQDLPNGFIWQPQLVDTKFAPQAPAAPMPAEAPQVEVAESAEEEEAAPEQPETEEVKAEEKAPETPAEAPAEEETHRPDQEVKA